MLRRFTCVASALAISAAALTASGCGEEDETPASAPLDLTIGGLIPSSGGLSYFAPSAVKSMDLAVGEIRQAIDETGADDAVEVVSADTQSDPQAAVSAARAVVAQDANCLVGLYSTAETIPVAEAVAIPEELVLISPSSTSDETSAVEDDGYLNRTILPNRLQAQALADLVEEGLGSAQGTVVNIGARNDAYGVDLAETFRAAWEEKGGEIGQEVIYDPEQSGYDSEADQIVEGDPDGWVILDFPETFSVVGPALVRTGDWDPARTFVPEGLYSATLPDQLGGELIEGIRGTNPGSPDDADAAKAFDDLYKQAPGTKGRELSDSQAFDAVVLCYLAAVAAGSVDGAEMVTQLQAVSGPPGEKFTFEQLPEAIESLEAGNDIDYQGASGPIDLDDAGDPSAGIYDLFRYDSGELVEYEEISVGG